MIQIIKNFRTVKAEQHLKHGPFQAQSPGAAAVICPQRLGNRSSAEKLGLGVIDEFTESPSCWEAGGRNLQLISTARLTRESSRELRAGTSDWPQRGGGSASR